MSTATKARPITVLLVEDNPGDARLILELLGEVQAGGFDLERVGRLDHALDRLARTGVDVVLLDLGLPDSQGLDTFVRARRGAPDEPIVVISGLDDERLALEAVRSGAQDYLVKGRIEGHLLARVLRYAVERKRAEQDLIAREERFRALVEHSADAIALLDRTGTVVYASHSTERVLGYGAEELLGRHAMDLIHPDDVAAVSGRLLELQDRPGAAVVMEARYHHKDGSWRFGECSVANRLADAAVHALVLNFREITERRRLEEQLRQAQKLEAVGRLAGGVAHDFNNVLTAIFGYADLLNEDLPEGHQARQDLEEIRKAAQRASTLTRQLLAFSRQQVLQPMVLSPNDLIEDIASMLGRLVAEDIELRFALDPSAGNVRADAGQIQQVVMNLVVNARDAMPTGGKLLIETGNAELGEQYAESHQPVSPGAYVMLAVSDTGVGMDAQTRARIFEPFFTTKEKGRGTGLGLSTVYGIVKQSGGYVWVYSEPGRGTTFKIYLPRVDAPAEPLVPPPEGRTLAGTETILLAEDDEMLRPLSKSLLERLGYTVLDTENALQAVALANAHAGPIQLLVADVVMPGASGRELARRLAQSRPDMRVLYVSGYTDDAIVQHGMLEPGLNFLQKPFTPATLARKVREVLDAS